MEKLQDVTQQTEAIIDLFDFEDNFRLGKEFGVLDNYLETISDKIIQGHLTYTAVEYIITRIIIRYKGTEEDVRYCTQYIKRKLLAYYVENMNDEK
ncbi:MAG: hypothetical protein K6D61_08970 [Prevotella sp.]|nr:hypothetical protein [Prevotella sp.]